jgi:hypothetical protein
MHTVLSSIRRAGEAVLRHPGHLILPLVIAALLIACSGDGALGPQAPTARQPAGVASVAVTSNYSLYDTRTEFDRAGVIDQLNDFEQFSGDLVVIQDTPWSSKGVTYTSGLNIILLPGLGVGNPSNSISADFGEPVSGQFAADDAFTLFGVDLDVVIEKTPVSITLFTNRGSYAFPNLDVPMAASGRKFFGVALSNAGEYFTGFRFGAGPNTGVLLDNVAVGHVAARNADPDVAVGGPYTGTEGSSISLSMNGSDADGDALTYSWDLGDGTKGSGGTPPASHTYADNGAYNIMLAVADGRGGVDTARTTATISNVAPTLAAFSLPATPIALANGSATVPVSSTFTDPGTLDTHTAALDCGVGVTVQSAASNGTAAGSCTFSSPGVYLVQLTVLDDDGGSDTKLAAGQIVVYDVSAGSVTGGGWISSPTGAYAPAPTVAGKLTFGFVARYQSSSTPDGNAEFKLNFGKLDFRSTALDWLVVGDGVAQLRGRGTVNGSGDYGFAVVAVDGIPDAIRIRIWERQSGTILYDNRAGEPLVDDAVTALGGGSIQLHSH